MNKKQKNVLYRIIASIIMLIIVMLLPVDGILRLLLFMVPYLTIGHDVLKKAWKGIKKRQPFDEHFLMGVATIGAIVLGEYVEGAAVMLFYQIGELFQSIAVGKSRQNITELMDIRPDHANVENADGSLTETDPDEVEVGTVIVVRPGEKVPIDGIVIEGSSSLDTAALTGESVPRSVHEGEDITSGCINISGLLKVRTTKEFGESTVSKILDMVENASSRKSRPENFISKFAKVYTPAVCYSAVALALIPPVISIAILHIPANWGNWIYRALTFLVISCPCAVVVSIPLSFFAGIGGASNAGVLVKGSNYLESLSKVKYVVFDKTGTITKGVFEVTEIKAAEGQNDDCGKYEAGNLMPGNYQPENHETENYAKDQRLPEPSAPAEQFSNFEGSISATGQRLLELSALAESFSSHPIAQSILKAYAGEVDKTRVGSVEEISGKGLHAVIDGHDVYCGNAALMDELGVSYESCGKPGTIVYTAEDGHYLGYLLISDIVKETSAAAIAALKKNGIKETIMLTGDRKEAAEAIASEVGVDRVYAGLLPGDKVAKVEELLDGAKSGEMIAFAGDGINDAPVLTRADVGIAMGALGADAAIEAADVVLMDDDPMKIVKAIRISKKCLRIVYENIYFSIGVKLLCLLLGAVGIANMWLAIFADVGVMVIAVLNAIRALNVKKL